MGVFSRILSAVVILLALLLVIVVIIGSSGVVPFNAELASSADGKASNIMGASFLGLGFIIRWLENVQGSPWQIASSLGPIILVAGFSDTLGNAVILFANRVKPNRFAATILVNTLIFVVGYVIWVLSISVVATVVFSHPDALLRAVLAVTVGYTPLIYGFLIALPYIGVLISNVLYLFTAIMMVSSLQVFFLFSPWQAILCAVFGFTGVLAFRLTIGRPIVWLSGKLLNFAAGTRIQNRIDAALAYAERLPSTAEEASQVMRRLFDRHDSDDDGAKSDD